MTGMEQLSDDVQALKQIVLQQQAELDRRDSVLAHIDLNIETILSAITQMPPLKIT